ncbi:hypothetical protein OWV82_016773 [Melia azedarach]|uniref:Uncharacterized protein n=1 Tax=Melia azedarach TaxID=155640 RepID=A0ACC1XI13_MELAZ|nr:hypothetical protein OWV82_016773 [Melia azedarach]
MDVPNCIFPPPAQSIATNSGNEDQNAVNNGNGVQSIARNNGNNGNGNRSIATNGGNGNGGGRRNYQGNSPPSEYGSSFSSPEYENKNPNSPSTAP